MGYKMRGKTFDDFNAGDEILTAVRTVTEADVVNFAGLSGDYHPEHMNEEFAKDNPFGERIAHGVLILAMATGLVNQTGAFEGTTISVLEMRIRYTQAVRFGDTIRVILKIVDKRETKKTDRGIITSEVIVLNQKDEPVLRGEWVVMMYRKDRRTNSS